MRTAQPIFKYAIVASACLIGIFWNPAWSQVDPGCATAAIQAKAEPESTEVRRLAATKQIQSMPRRAHVIGIGDSLIAGWPNDLLTLPGKFSSYWNFGFPGDTTGNVLWRMAQAPLEQLDPAKVLLLVGTNDLNVGLSVCDTVFGIERILSVIKSKWPRADVGVISIPPRGRNNSEFLAERTQVNKALQVLSRNGLRFEMIQLPDAQLACATDGGGCTYYQDDYLHFNRRGYSVLNRSVHKFLER